MAREVVENESVDYRSLAHRLVSKQHNFALCWVALHLPMICVLNYNLLIKTNDNT
jgi:hypothetical protein